MEPVYGVGPTYVVGMSGLGVPPCMHSSSNDSNCRRLQKCLPPHTDSVAMRHASLLDGNESCPVLVSMQIPRKARLVVGPAILYSVQGEPKLLACHL